MRIQNSEYRIQNIEFRIQKWGNDLRLSNFNGKKRFKMRKNTLFGTN